MRVDFYHLAPCFHYIAWMLIMHVEIALFLCSIEYRNIILDVGAISFTLPVILVVLTTCVGSESSNIFTFFMFDTAYICFRIVIHEFSAKLESIYLISVIISLFFFLNFLLILPTFQSQGHLHTYRFCDNVWTFILQDALFKNEDKQENVGRVKIVACDSKLLNQ
jgi:hypothetical protein